MLLERGGDLHEAEAFTGIGRKMVCNPQGTRGKGASPARENAAPPGLLPKVLARLCSLPPLCGAVSNWEGKLFPTLQYTAGHPHLNAHMLSFRNSCIEL